MATIFKISVDGVEYDIVPSKINRSTEIASDATTDDAEILFKCASGESTAIANLVQAVIGLNTKGNLAVESLNKHVNIESAQSVQIKPASGKIIVDSGKKLKTEVFDSEEIAFREGMGADDVKDANVMRMEFNFDDISDYNTITGASKPTFNDGQKSKKEGSDGYWSKVNIAGRSFDIRCHNHGGIALQVAGCDGDNGENKIKFESSRAKSIDEAATFPADYQYEGGKGMEFGTFNNLHTSLFTKDYRFNMDAMVYAVKRGTIESADGKVDYPTQLDDFKDIIQDNSANGNATYSNGAWSAASGKEIIGVTWKDIILAVMYIKQLTAFTTWKNTFLAAQQ